MERMYEKASEGYEKMYERLYETMTWWLLRLLGGGCCWRVYEIVMRGLMLEGV